MQLGKDKEKKMVWHIFVKEDIKTKKIHENVNFRRT